MAVFWNSYGRLSVYISKTYVHHVRFASKRRNFLYSLKLDVREELIKDMLSDTGDRDTVIVLENPGDIDFIKSFVRPGVRHVLCSYPNLNHFDKMKSANMPEGVSCVRPAYYQSMFRFLPEIDVYKQEVNVRFLYNTLDIEHPMFPLRLFYCKELRDCYVKEINGVNISYYWLGWPNLLEASKKLSTTPFFRPFKPISTELMELKFSDIELVTKVLFQSNRRDDETISLVKTEQDPKVKEYLLTMEDRQLFNSFCLWRQELTGGVRLAPHLHKLFPGCLNVLSQRGFFINALVKDLTIHDWLYIYLCLSQLPGFEKSDLKILLDSIEDSLNKYGRTKMAYNPNVD